MSAQKFQLLCLGNPLLDIQVNGDQELLDKYDLKADDAILIEDKHKPIYQELVSKYNPLFVPGGAAQNSARGAQYVLPPNSVVYVGCVGDDEYAEILRKGNEKEGVFSAYRVDKEVPTGKCGAIITGVHRSLVTDLGAANHYKLEHLKSPEIWSLVEGAEVYYVGGYHLTVCVPAIKALGEHAAEKNKIFSINLSAPFIPQFFKEQLSEVLPYADFLIGNESEALSYAEANGLETKDIAEIAKSIAKLPKVNEKRQRVVVITQGTEPTVVVTATSGEPTVQTYPVRVLAANEVVDTNGAGDAFAGGFIGALVAGKSVDEAVDVGQWLASWGIRQTGPSYPYPKQVYAPSS
ncbi:Ribokinase-like protein [Ascobolus immersus RN42]|uniref:Adenosine kinase n=1 Tax=Ascobolus immersus RN42 TaxID=1160509 RepID=A0A3N4IPA6_ASCIM|nr:Ribokinase-like protein [Ascobolus immersus RN42]